MKTSDPSRLGLAEIGRRLAGGSLTARDLLDATQARHDPSLHAYKAWTPDMAARQAHAAEVAFAAGARTGALQGIPVSLKDLFGIADLPTFAGSPRELPVAWRTEGPLVRALRNQLAVIAGKTHTVEFAFGGLGASKHWPVPWNPHDRARHRAPGGSSSGAGVSLVEGTALVAFGTDTGGSVRIPASLTGTVGLKTTWGRWSLKGVVPLSPSHDSVGLLARSAADAAYAFEAVDGDPVPRRDGVRGLRIGIADRFFFDDAAPGVAERVMEALRAIEAAGATLTSAELPGCGEIFDLYRTGGTVAAELYRFLRCELPEWLETLDPGVRRRLESGSGLAAWEYLERRNRYGVIGTQALPVFGAIDVLVGPTVPITPPLLAELSDPAVYARLNLLALRNTCVVSFMGLCAVSIPAGRDAAGMPVGLQLIGAPGSEAGLLSIARCFETVLKRRDVWDPPGVD